MKTFTKILTAAAATALLATSCVNEDPAYKNNEPGTPPDPNAKGYLTLADMSMRVVVDTDTETRPDDTSDETAKPQTRTDEAQPDVDTFIIEIRDATGKLALQETYGDLKVSIGEAGRLELPVGGYTMEVRSEEAATTPAAEWEHPVYFGSQEFVIEKNQTTPINEVVCTLNNIKVTLMCSKDLADQLTADTKSTVTLGETTMKPARPTSCRRARPTRSNCTSKGLSPIRPTHPSGSTRASRASRPDNGASSRS